MKLHVTLSQSLSSVLHLGKLQGAETLWLIAIASVYFWIRVGCVLQRPARPENSRPPWLQLLLHILHYTPFSILGGRQSKYAVNAFEVFDIETRSWTKFPNIPSKRAFSSFVCAENNIFSLGGLRQGRLYRQPKFMKNVDVFDIEQGEFFLVFHLLFSMHALRARCGVGNQFQKFQILLLRAGFRF